MFAILLLRWPHWQVTTTVRISRVLNSNPERDGERKLNRRVEFVDNCTDTSFACDNMDFTYAFRVAEDIGEVPEDGSSLSKPFGDAVTLSVLLAARDCLTQQDDNKASLDDLFKKRFKNIKTDHIGDEERNPASRPKILEDLLTNGMLRSTKSHLNASYFETRIYGISPRSVCHLAW